MKRRPVESSNLKSVGYDERGRVLEIEFRNGRVYRYSGVPKSVYDELMRAPSLGRYFIVNIRDDYEYERAA